MTAPMNPPLHAHFTASVTNTTIATASVITRIVCQAIASSGPPFSCPAVPDGGEPSFSGGTITAPPFQNLVQGGRLDNEELFRRLDVGKDLLE